MIHSPQNSAEEVVHGVFSLSMGIMRLHSRHQSRGEAEDTARKLGGAEHNFFSGTITKAQSADYEAGKITSISFTPYQD